VDNYSLVLYQVGNILWQVVVIICGIMKKMKFKKGSG
jgi:hypothetical protein